MIPLNVMFAIEEIHCAKEVEVGAKCTLAAGGTVLMLNDNGWLIAHRPARLAGAQAPVQVFAIHKKALVEQSDSLDHLAPNEHACAADGVNFDRLIGVDKREVIAPESPAPGEQPTQSRQAIERHG